MTDEHARLQSIPRSGKVFILLRKEVAAREIVSSCKSGEHFSPPEIDTLSSSGCIRFPSLHGRPSRLFSLGWPSYTLSHSLIRSHRPCPYQTLKSSHFFSIYTKNPDYNKGTIKSSHISKFSDTFSFFWYGSMCVCVCGKPLCGGGEDRQQWTCCLLCAPKQKGNT